MWLEESLNFIDSPQLSREVQALGNLIHSSAILTTQTAPYHPGPQFLSNAQNGVRGRKINLHLQHGEHNAMERGLHLTCFPRDRTRKETPYRSLRKNVLWQCFPSGHRGVALQVK